MYYGKYSTSINKTGSVICIDVSITCCNPDRNEDMFFQLIYEIRYKSETYDLNLKVCVFLPSINNIKCHVRCHFFNYSLRADRSGLEWPVLTFQQICGRCFYSVRQCRNANTWYPLSILPSTQYWIP